MTILPKKKTSSASKTSDHIHRDSQATSNPDFPIPHGSNQSGVQSGPGCSSWNAAFPPGSSPGWCPPGSGVSSSQRWNSSVNSGPGDFVVESVGSKRSSSSGNYSDEPTSSKRRHVEPRSENVTSSETSSVQSPGSLVCGNLLINATGPNGAVSPARSVTPPQAGPSQNCEGYNSEDEYSQLGLMNLTEEEWLEKDIKFEKAMKKNGFLITKIVEDGSCLFRAVADQIYGDQEMHPCVRKHCMDYIAQNSDYYSQYVTEDIADYIARKRYLGVHGNHLEIQAISELYNRPVHIYCYSTEPINIFQGVMNNSSDSHLNAPLRLCYHRGVHYNSIIDPHKPTIGVGLGLPGMIPGSADRNLLSQAYRANEDVLVEQAMLEDKIKATDWEATNEVIQEQVARESYLQWIRDNERRNKLERSSTVTSGDLRSEPFHSRSPKANSPKPGCSSTGPTNSPKAGCSFYKDRDSPVPQKSFSSQSGSSSAGFSSRTESGFQLLETATFLNGLPPEMFGLEDWNETDVLTQVIAASQQEYLDSLKKNKHQQTNDQKTDSEDNPRD